MLSQGEVVLRPGPLYGALDRLTESGAAALTTQVQRLRRNADAAATRLRLAFGGAL
jgi:hypothetical protein